MQLNQGEKKEYKAALYLRISREDGDGSIQSESIGNQRELLVRYAGENGFTIKGEYVDDGYSGTSFERPAFLRMLRDIENGLIDAVITKDLSRLGRDYIGIGHYLERYFPEHGVRYIAVNDGIDTMLDTSGNDVTPFRAVINDLYARDISKKVRSALDTKRACGKFIGARAPYGYRKSTVDKNLLEPYEPEAVWVRALFELFLSGKSLCETARLLTRQGAPLPNAQCEASSWNDATVRRILTSPTYAGDITQGRSRKLGYKVKKRVTVPRSEWVIVQGTHEGIVSRVDFDAAQALLKRRANHARGAHAVKYPLAGLVHCSACGKPMTLLRQGTREYLVCSGWKKGNGCGLSHCIRADDVLKATVCALQNELCGVDSELLLRLYIKQQSTKQPNNSTLQYALKKNHAASFCLYRDRASEEVTEAEYVRFAQALQQEESALQERIINSKVYADSAEKKVAIRIQELLHLQAPEQSVFLLLLNRIEVGEAHALTIRFAFCKPHICG